MAVYDVAKSRGMDVVTLTDHDSIDGCLALLNAHPLDDFLVSEEVSCVWPGADIQVHLCVYGMTEALHRELQPLRGSVFAVIDALTGSDVFFSMNHLFHFYREQVPLETYLRLLCLVPAVEAQNGTMLREHNELIARLVRGLPNHAGLQVHPPVALLGGSDAHTLRRVGQTWTQSQGSTATEFLGSLRQGLAEPGGNHGTAATVAGDTYGVVARYIASLLGYGPRDHRGWARAACLAFVAVSAPAQFLPMLIALQGKRRERLMIARAIDALAEQTPVPATVASRVTGSR